MPGSVIFLGLARRAGPAPDQLNSPIGVQEARQIVPCHLFPFVPAGWAILLGVKIGAAIQGELRIVTRTGDVWVKAGFELHGSGGGAVLQVFGWTLYPLILGGEPRQYSVRRPAEYFVEFHHASGVVEHLGAVVFAYERAPELTPALIQALRADPRGVKMAVLRFADEHGAPVLHTYCALDRGEVDLGTLPPSTMWYRDLPDSMTFMTSRGPEIVDLTFIRESAHWLLIDPQYRPPNASYQNSYSVQDLFAAIDRFVQLIDSNPPEEAVQVRLAANPVLLAPFAPERIYLKPKILTEFVADFGFINSRGELYLVEIEQPSMRLFTQSRQPSARLTQSISQVDSWLALAMRHRAAVLQGIDPSLNDVRSVRGVVVAGRSAGADRGLDQLYARGGAVEVMTYDHLVAAIRNVVRDTIRQSSARQGEPSVS